MRKVLYLVVLVSILLCLGTASASTNTINVWVGYPELEPFFKWAGVEFAKTHPGVDVQVFSTSLREFEQKLTTAVSSGTGPEVYEVAGEIAAHLIDAGLIAENPKDLDTYLKSGPWSQFAINFTTINGKSYGIPFMDGSRAALYYNKKMFKEAGLDPNKPPKTFDELMQYARKLTKYDSSGKVVRSGLSLRLSGGGSGLSEKFRFFLHNYGGDLIVPTKDGKWKNGLDNKAGQDALKFYIDALYKYNIDDPQVKHDADAFVTENTAMFLRESWVIGEIKSKNPNLEYGVAPMPGAVRFDIDNQPQSMYISKDGIKSQDVRDFVKFITSEQAASKLVELSGWVPVRKFDSAPITGKVPQYNVFLNPPAGHGSYSDVVIPCFDEIQTKVAEKLSADFLDKKLLNNPDGIKKAMHDIAELVDSILKRNNVYGN